MIMIMIIACSSNCELCSSLDDCVKCKDGTFRNEENGKCEGKFIYIYKYIYDKYFFFFINLILKLKIK